MSRILLTAPITLYFGPGGSSSGNGSIGSPFDCPVTAWQYVQQNYDLGGLPGLVVLFQALSGTLTLPGVGNIVGPLVGQVGPTSVKFLGSATSPSSYIIDGRPASTVAFGATFGAQFSMGGFHMYSGQANVAVDGAASRILNTEKCLSDVCQDYSWSATNYGRLDLMADNDIYSLSASYLNVFGGDITVPQTGRTVTVMGNSLTATQGFISAGDGRIVDSNTSYPGYNTYGPKVTMSGNAYVHTGSSTPTSHFPGQSSYGTGGVVSTGNGNNLL